MKNPKKRWTAALLLTFVVLLGLCGGTVRLVDPFFHYHNPDPEGEVWFDQRAQGAGLLRSQEYETVLMGSSLAANYRPFWFDVFYETSTVKVTFPNGGFGEFTRALDYACTQQDVERVIFGLDPNLLARDPEEEPDQLPEYLYDTNPWNDGQYLLNKDVLMRSGYTLLKKMSGETQSIQDAFVWDGNVFFSKELALAGYERPEATGETLAADAFLENGRANLERVTGWLEQYPDTEFIFFFSPYSILFWDKTARLGQTEAMLSALEQACNTLLTYDNVKLYGFLLDREIVENLDNYCDYVHHSGAVCRRILAKMAAGEDRLTAENTEKVLANWRDFVVDYDYEKFWDESFWWKWNETHPGVPA